MIGLFMSLALAHLMVFLGSNCPYSGHFRGGFCVDQMS